MHDRIMRLLKSEDVRERDLELRYEGRMRTQAKYKDINLKRTARGNKAYYYGREVGGKWNYLGDESNKDVAGIKEYKQMEASLKQIKANREAFKKFEESYKPVTVGKVDVPKTYRFENNMSGSKSNEAMRWKSENELRKAEYEPYYPKALIHVTDDGTKVRSKSEVIIYNTLLKLGITFIYELPIDMEGETIWPDFTIYNELDGEIYILEHLGMLGKPEYRKKLEKKITDYDALGFVLGDKLLVTADNIQGEINAKSIERLLWSSFA